MGDGDDLLCCTGNVELRSARADVLSDGGGVHVLEMDSCQLLQRQLTIAHIPSLQTAQELNKLAICKLYPQDDLAIDKVAGTTLLLVILLAEDRVLFVVERYELGLSGTGVPRQSLQHEDLAAHIGIVLKGVELY